MSYQGQAWAWKIRGINRGERAVLDFIAWRQDQRTNVAKAALAEIAEHCEMGERQVTRILQQLDEKRIVKRIMGGDGRGHIPLYSLVGFVLKATKKGDIPTIGKGDILAPERATFPAEKGDIPDTLIRKEEKSLRNPEENRNPPNPLFSKGGSNPAPLTQREISRLRRELLRVERDWERNREARVGGDNSVFSIEYMVQIACDRALLRYEDAWPYVERLWTANERAKIAMKKPVQAAG